MKVRCRLRSSDADSVDGDPWITQEFVPKGTTSKTLARAPKPRDVLPALKR